MILLVTVEVVMVGTPVRSPLKKVSFDAPESYVQALERILAKELLRAPKDRRISAPSQARLLRLAIVQLAVQCDEPINPDDIEDDDLEPYP